MYACTRAQVLWEFGEETKSRSIAKKIVAARQVKPLETTLQLSYLLGGDKARVFTGRRVGLHPATLTFQALRIAVNRELSVSCMLFLEKFVAVEVTQGNKTCVCQHNEM